MSSLAVTVHGMDVKALRELCQKLNEIAALQDIMEGDPINTALHREASQALEQALSEIERLKCEADLHRRTSEALREARFEIERLRSDAGLNQPNQPSLLRGHTHGTIDWITQFLERKQALTGQDSRRNERHRD
jgi:hypothetical protein